MRNYEDQHRSSRQHSPERTHDYISQPPTTSSSSSRLYQQNYTLSRSVTLPETSHQSRRSNSYNMPIRQDHDIQHDGKRKTKDFLYEIL